ncbi:hypothetical protein FRC15_009104 [Serendipita sp. 397]|nr:hypothetical protein FRC15_009104 [Serendipita sp. 397]
MSLADGMRRTGDIKGAVACYLEVLELLVTSFEESKGDENEDEELEKARMAARQEFLAQMHHFCEETTSPALNETYAPHRIHPQTVDDIRALCSSVLRTRSSIFGLLHPDAIASRRLLVSLLYATGRWSDAIELAEAYLTSLSGTSEEKVPGRAETKYLLGTMLRYYDESEKEEALEFIQEVYQSRTKLFGRAHEKTIYSVLDVVDLLETLGRLEEAMELQESHSKLAEEVWSEMDPQALLFNSNYAILLAKEGREDEANEILRSVTDHLAKLGNKNRRPILGAMVNRARVLVELEEADDAEKAFEVSMGLQVSALGEAHPDTLRTYEDFAYLLQSLDELPRALALREQVSMIRKQTIGQRHPLTLQAMFEQASCLGALDRFAEARVLLEEVAEGYGVMLGRETGRFIETLQALGTVLVQLGEPLRAKVIHEQVLDIVTKKHGPKDERTIAATVALAGVIWSCGRETEGLAMEVKAMELQREVLGPKHPTTLQTMHNHAVSLQSIGRYSVSLALLRDVHAWRKEVLGEAHAHTVASLYSLAVSLEGLGQNAEALKTVEEVVNLGEKSYSLEEMSEDELTEYQDALDAMRKEFHLFEEKIGSMK